MTITHPSAFPLVPAKKTTTSARLAPALPSPVAPVAKPVRTPEQQLVHDRRVALAAGIVVDIAWYISRLMPTLLLAAVIYFAITQNWVTAATETFSAWYGETVGPQVGLHPFEAEPLVHGGTVYGPMQPAPAVLMSSVNG